MAACRDEPITCRRKIADRLDLKPGKKRTWQFEGACPVCGHGGFSITAGTQGHYPPRHIWFCNCHRHRCDAGSIRAAMVGLGIPADCLGTYGRKRAAAPADHDAAELRAQVERILADREVRSPSELRLRMAEVAWGSAPVDWRGFVAFAERAGVSRSKRYEAAARWGRGQPQ